MSHLLLDVYQVGIKARIKVVESAVYSSMIVEGKHQSMIPSDWWNSQHPLISFTYFYDQKIVYNYSRVNDEHFVYVFDQLKKTLDREEFVKTFRELILYTMEQSYMIAGAPEADLIYW